MEQYDRIISWIVLVTVIIIIAGIIFFFVKIKNKIETKWDGKEVTIIVEEVVRNEYTGIYSCVDGSINIKTENGIKIIPFGNAKSVIFIGE